MNKPYFLLIKTADAEKRTITNSQFINDKRIFPIIEITRGRKIPKKNSIASNPDAPGIYAFEKNYKNFVKNIDQQKFAYIDITREPLLSCFETEEICKSDDGYQNWVNFFNQIKKTHPNFQPIIISNPALDEDSIQYEQNIKKQFLKLSETSSHVAYRANIFTDNEFLYDLIILKDLIQKHRNSGKHFNLILDHEYIRSSVGRNHANRTKKIIASCLDYCTPEEIVILSTSFPKSVTDIGGEEFGEFFIEEYYLYNAIKNTYPQVCYGDYGSVNPIRNDEVIMASGWRPRIDYQCYFEGELKCYYHRERRDIIATIEISPTSKKNIYAPYDKHYQSVARKVIKDNRFETLPNSWGLQKIIETSEGQIASTAPSFWISARIDTHVNFILKNSHLFIF